MGQNTGDFEYRLSSEQLLHIQYISGITLFINKYNNYLYSVSQLIGVRTKSGPGALVNTFLEIVHSYNTSEQNFTKSVHLPVHSYSARSRTP